MVFLGKHFFLYNLFSQSATLPVYLFVSLFVNLHFLSYSYFSALSIIQDFSLNFARTLGRAVDKLLNSSRVNSHGQFIFGKQRLSLRLKEYEGVRACLHGGGGPQVGEVTRLGGVTRLSI